MADDDDRQALARLTEEILPTLIARFEASSLGELEVRREGWRIRLRRPPHLPAPAIPSGNGAYGRAGVALRPSAGAGSAAGAGSSDSAGSSAPASSSPAVATSPAVGTFTPLESVGAGRQVRSGEVLGHVDVLGVRQEVVSPHDGIVLRVVAQPGEAVEYGQELVRLDARAAAPSGHADAGFSQGEGSA
ncbi:MAG TPA: biotin/lipoyl-containing protein [Candidatus Limnocylindrales bacterium]|nr:biotin/lipoyl-containing protein [Candidatus Limnocylindrales bacterium]